MPNRTLGRIAVVRKAALFSGLSDRELESLAARAVSRRYGPGALIFSEGDPCDGLYVVEAGAVKIFKTSSSGRQQVLTVEGSGGTVAELPVFDGGDYPASASAVGETTLLFISKQDLRGLCLKQPEVALKVLKVVSSRLRQLVGIIEELSFTTVRHRLGMFLLREAERQGKRTPRGIELTLSASQEELASYIGTVRELVSRNLGRLQAEGIIKIEGKGVIIPDLRVLKGEVENDQGEIPFSSLP